MLVFENMKWKSPSLLYIFSEKLEGHGKYKNPPNEEKKTKPHRITQLWVWFIYTLQWLSFWMRLSGCRALDIVKASARGLPRSQLHIIYVPFVCLWACIMCITNDLHHEFFVDIEFHAVYHCHSWCCFQMSHSKVRQRPGMGGKGECFRCGREGHW